MSKIFYMKEKVKLASEGERGYYPAFTLEFDLIGFILNDTVQFMCLNETSTFKHDCGLNGGTNLTIDFFNNINDSTYSECFRTDIKNKDVENKEFSDQYVKNNIGFRELDHTFKNYHFFNLKDGVFNSTNINKNISLNKPYLKFKLDVSSGKSPIVGTYYFNELKNLSEFNDKFPLLVAHSTPSSKFLEDSSNQNIFIYKITNDIYMANMYMVKSSNYRQYIQNETLSVKLDYLNTSRGTSYFYYSRIFKIPDNNTDFSYIIMNDSGDIVCNEKINKDEKRIFGIQNFIELPRLIISGNTTGNLGTFTDDMRITYNASSEDTRLTVDAYINGNKIYTGYCSILDGKIILNVSKSELYKIGPNKTNQKIKFIISDSKGNKVTVEQTFNIGNLNMNPSIKYTGLDDLGEKTKPFKILFEVVDLEKDTTKTYVTIGTNTYSLGNSIDNVFEVTQEMLTSIGSNNKNNTIEIKISDDKHSETITKTITFDTGSL